MRPDTHSEDYKITSKDDLNVTFSSHIIVSLRPGSCKEVVDDYGGEDWYARIFQEPSRTVVREAVRTHDAFDIKTESADIGASIHETLTVKYKDTPFIVESVSIGNIDYPDKVMEEIEKKLAKEQALAAMDLRGRLLNKKLRFELLMLMVLQKLRG
jgi:regulator of protease activity HflC (stomatin/prohibitin superfamily)